MSCLADISITDSNGIVNFDQPPERVVVINWTLTEQILALGVQPVGVADIPGYLDHHESMGLTDETTDVGSRLAPDLTSIRALKPDVIIVGYSQRPLIRVLSNIAPVVYFKNFSRRYDNAEKADERFLELARLFDRSHEAQQSLLQRDAMITNLREQLTDHFGSQPPAVTVMVIDDTSHAWTFGENSMAFYALQRLGLHQGWQQPPSQYGVEKTATKDLLELPGCVLFVSKTGFDPSRSANWQQLKAMQSGCFYRLPPTPFYGGAMSLQTLAEHISQSLLQAGQD
jgi:iron complex transport system substrate-binding protein